MQLLIAFIEFLELQARNHSIYVWGGQGETGSQITEAWIRKRETSDTNANRAIAFWKKQCAAGYGAVLRAFDCSGLGMYWLKNLKGLYKSDMSANTMMSKCTKITRDKLQRGDWVFRVSSGKAYHIGYVVDDKLNVIEAMGRDSGVVKRPLNASGASYWNAYGRPAIFQQESASAPAAATPSGSTPTLRKGDKGADVKRMQELLMKKGVDLPKYGADGDFGIETDAAVRQLQRDSGLTVDGIVGPKTWAKLTT